MAGTASRGKLALMKKLWLVLTLVGLGLLSWRQGNAIPEELDPLKVVPETHKLVFENQSLGEIAAELNRYNRQVIDIQGEALRAEQVTGVFQSHDPESFLAFVRRVPGVSVELSSDGSRYVVRAAK